MRKTLQRILSCMLALSLFLCVEVVAETETCEGMIIGFTEDGFTIYADGNIRSITITEDTVFDTDGELGIGDVITVGFSDPDGETLHADAVTCHRIFGIVTDIIRADEPYLMFKTDGEETLRVNLTQLQADSCVMDMPVTVYYNGMRTRSIPAQITAQYICGTMLSGTVIALEKDDVTLLTDDGEIVILHRSADTVIPTEVEIGANICAEVTPQMRLSYPAQYEALNILTISER